MKSPGLALSPMNRRRLDNFRRNRRGYWSFWIFLVLFVCSLFSELIANDKPFYVSYEGHSYFPALIDYPETAFGGDFETAADYRDPFLQKLMVVDRVDVVLAHQLQHFREQPRVLPGQRAAAGRRRWRQRRRGDGVRRRAFSRHPGGDRQRQAERKAYQQGQNHTGAR